ncbi:FAD/NAD(P)-binding domain-containing protein [Aspergillus ambiguus]|uniref:flavin-containing monooxygenase n=1 Tax=Aspergillus ambiguus TaxID=176160 RepID=UPI003CCD222F
MSIINSKDNSSVPTMLNEQIDSFQLAQLESRYEDERKKRLRDDGNAQFIEIAKSPAYELRPLHTKFPGQRSEILIIGAGWGGIQNAVRMIEAGIPPGDIRIIDPAGGFGGTWYWNRYPGLMCDIESYLYLPYLEKTGYMPKHRYSQGEEILEYVNLVAEKWGLTDCAVFQTQAQKLVWDDDSKEWSVSLIQRRKGKSPETLEIRSKFVTIAAGVLNWPKLPHIPGILDYQGDMFHSARWAYGITGGSPKDPSLTELKDKRVAIIGTGATAVQIVPQLAQWCKHLYVVQRTPASVDVRDQRETDEQWFHREVARSKGWQRERMRNFHQHFTLGETPAVNLVDDGWTRAPALVALTGYTGGPKLPEEIPPYRAKLIEIDSYRQNRIHSRVDHEVNDPLTAEKLKPWYPVWCKRPLFHDDYLKTFNEDNVTLVDTDGKGIDRMTADSLVVGNKTYQADVVIFATGFLAPPAGTPAEKANMSVIGLNGVSMSEEWQRLGPTTLHGVIDAKFPNLFLSGPQQASTSGNYRFNLDEYAKHISYILVEAKRRANGAHVVIAPSTEAAEDWGMQVMLHSAPMGAGIGCTPGYFNLEGDLDRMLPEKQMVLARSGLWGSGIEHWLEIIENWRAEGDMMGIVVR